MKKSSICLAINLGGLGCTIFMPSIKFIALPIQVIAFIAQMYFITKGE